MMNQETVLMLAVIAVAVFGVIFLVKRISKLVKVGIIALQLYILASTFDLSPMILTVIGSLLCLSLLTKTGRKRIRKINRYKNKAVKMLR